MPDTSMGDFLAVIFLILGPAFVYGIYLRWRDRDRSPEGNLIEPPLRAPSAGFRAIYGNAGSEPFYAVKPRSAAAIEQDEAA